MTGIFFFVKQKTAYEMRISDWSSDVCSSDLLFSGLGTFALSVGRGKAVYAAEAARDLVLSLKSVANRAQRKLVVDHRDLFRRPLIRSEEHTSELQSLMRTSYAVFCWKKKNHSAHTYPRT